MNRLDYIAGRLATNNLDVPPDVRHVYTEGPWDVVLVPRTPTYDPATNMIGKEAVRRAKIVKGWVKNPKDFFDLARILYILDLYPVYVLFNGGVPRSYFIADENRVMKSESGMVLPPQHKTYEILFHALSGVGHEVDWRPNETIPEDFYAS